VRVTRGDALPASRPDTIRPHSRSATVLQVGLLILAFALGFIVHQQDWHRPLVDFVSSLAQHPTFTIMALFRRSDLPTLRVDLQFEDYQLLIDKRAQAQRLGANITSDQDYVPAAIDHAGTTVDVQMRLSEGAASELNGETWPFEVTVQGSGTVLDLRRFILTPADTKVLSTWGYLETLRRADLLSPRYHLVRLLVNGTSKGIYAMEEYPSFELLAAQEQQGDAIAYFETNAYWEATTHLGGSPSGSGFQYAQSSIECAPLPAHPDNDQDMTDAAIPSQGCIEAFQTFRALQEGEISPSDALDVDRMSSFLALTALWWGTSELDWRTLRLAYAPTTNRFQPVGRGIHPKPITPLPSRFTDDPEIQTAYARALSQFSLPHYLDRLQIDLKDEMESLQLALGTEMGHLELPWAGLEAYQASMRRQINPSRTLFATIESDDTALVLRLSNTQPFPVEIIGLDIGETAFLPVSSTWVAEADRELLVENPDAVILRATVTSMPRAVHLRVPLESLPLGQEWERQSPGTIRVVTRLLGLADQSIIVVATSDVPTVYLGVEESLQ
jgi:hypothetical protein